VESAWYLKKIPLNPVRRAGRRGQGHSLPGLLRRRLHHGAGPDLDGGLTLGLTFESGPRDSASRAGPRSDREPPCMCVARYQVSRDRQGIREASARGERESARPAGWAHGQHPVRDDRASGPTRPEDPLREVSMAKGEPRPVSAEEFDGIFKRVCNWASGGRMMRGNAQLHNARARPPGSAARAIRAERLSGHTDQQDGRTR